MRHLLAGVGHVAHLAHAGGIHQKGRLCLAGKHVSERLIEVLDVFHMRLTFLLLGRDAENLFQNQLMQDGNIQRSQGFRGLRIEEAVHYLFVAQGEIVNRFATGEKSQGTPGLALLPQHPANLPARLGVGRRERTRFDLEPLGEGVQKWLRSEFGQTEDQPMRGQNQGAVVLHVDETHRDVVEGFLAGEIRIFSPQLITVDDRGLVTMMTVGDQQGLVVEQIVGLADDQRVGHLPEAMANSFVVDDLDFGLAFPLLARQGFNHAAGIGIERENRAEIGAARLEQIEAIGLGTGEGFFVRLDDAGGKLLQPIEGNEPAVHPAAALFARELLIVEVERRHGVPDQNPLLLPLLEIGGGPGIAIIRRAVPFPDFAENETHHVERAAPVEFRLHGRRDHVIGGSHNAGGIVDAGKVVTQTAKRDKFGHLSENSQFFPFVQGDTIGNQRNGCKGKKGRESGG